MLSLLLATAAHLAMAEQHCVSTRSPPTFRALSHCTAYESSTCCDRQQTDIIRSSLYYLHRTSDAGPACVTAWMAGACSRCHHIGGTLPKPPLCDSFCDTLHAACAEAFFAVDSTTQLLTPCRERDVLCSRLNETSTGGVDTCTQAGYAVVGPGMGWCFDGREPAGKPRKRSSRRQMAPDTLPPWAGVTVLVALACIAVAALVPKVLQPRLEATREEISANRLRHLGLYTDDAAPPPPPPLGPLGQGSG